MFVMVAGYSSSVGLYVVTPISMDPAHLETILSSRTSKSSFGLSGLFVSTTPLLKSSSALEKRSVITLKVFSLFS